MSRETVISIPEALLQEAERLAERLDKGRDELFVDALRDYLRRLDAESVTQRLDAVVDEVSSIEDRFVTSTTQSVLEQVEW